VVPVSTLFNTRFYPGLTVQPVKSAFELAPDAQLPAGRSVTLHVLLARAIDRTGFRQPDAAEPIEQFSAVVCHPVTAG
jgi:hypothetical protein